MLTSTSIELLCLRDPIAEMAKMPRSTTTISHKPCVSIICMVRDFMLAGAVAATTGYLVHVQFSKGMGNIWWRAGRLSPGGAWAVMMYALREPRMWRREYWDLNYPIWLIAGSLIGAWLKMRRD